jgi:hypothetical protein
MLTSERSKLITNIRERITAFFPSDDNRLDPDYIWEQALLTRAILIKRLIDKNNRTNEGFYSRIVLDLTEDTVTDTEFPGKKRAVLPKLIDVKNNIRYCGPEDLSDEYTRVGFDGFFRLSTGREWTGSDIYFVVFNDRIVFSSAPQTSLEVDYDTLAAWVLLEDIQDDPNFDEDTTRLVPTDYQLMLETMIADDILEYADKGLLNKTNNATDTDAV